MRRAPSSVNPGIPENVSVSVTMYPWTIDRKIPRWSPRQSSTSRSGGLKPLRETYDIVLE